MTAHSAARVAASSVIPRRPLATRHTAWARALARWLADAYVRPNSVSLASVAFAAAGCAAFAVVPTVDVWPRAAALVLAAVSIQLRLLCNLLDGMIAVEEGFKTSSGEIFNDVPDRVADLLLFAGAGYALRDIGGGPALGWLAAVMAIFTAYVRVLGGALGLPQHFTGPMAKQHRMFALTVGSLAAALETLWFGTRVTLWVALLAIAVGSLVTTIRRLHCILVEVEAR